MKARNCIATLFLVIFGATRAIDPFEGFIRLYCLKGRRVRGCSNETLAQAHRKTQDTEPDEFFSEPETRAYLYTRRNRKKPEPLHQCGGRLPSNTLYTANEDTVVLISGYLSSVCGFAYYREMKDQFLYRANYNVIVMDWSWGHDLDYFDAVRNSKLVGKQIAFMLENIVNQTGVTGDKFHLIGHSLGAHVAGYAGQHFRPGKIRRITGLDPAGPGFKNKPLDDRLDRTDAKMVDVIHGNGGECLPYAFGEFEPSGHADFYPNGGKVQLSSFSTILPRYWKGDFVYATACIYPPICYHLQSPEYFKVSINACQCQFIGVKCSNYEEFKSGRCRSCGSDGLNCAVMGMDWEFYPQKDGNHSYYLDTSLSCPFCDNRSIQREGFPNIPTKGDNKSHCFVTFSDNELAGMKEL